MSTPSQTLIDLEKKFWQSLVAQDTKTATQMLTEPALMVSSHGTLKFDHDGYRKMAEQGPMILTSFELSDVDVTFASESTAVVTYHVRQEVAKRDNGDRTVMEMNDTSTWVRTGGRWQCVVHTETPAETRRTSH